MDTYQDKLHRECQWHIDHRFQEEHLLNGRLFFSRERAEYNYAVARRAMAEVLARLLSDAGLARPRMLIAPIGAGDDLEYVQPLASEITGVDISQAALDRIADPRIRKLQADMRQMSALADGSFDVVLAPLFFHHFHGAMAPFLRELTRVLKPGGVFLTMEPSVLHPLSWITRPLRHLVGNITGQVEDEAPLVPATLARAMRRCGLRDVHVEAASFTHNRVPVFLAWINNALTQPLRRMPLVRQFAWMCLFSGRKPCAS